MRNSLMTFAALLALPVASASADESCFVPMSGWQPREAVAQLAKDKGWTVRRIKIDDGCYEVDGKDTAGRAFEATIHPATLEVIRIEREDDRND